VREGTVAEEQVEVSEEKAAQRRREKADSALVAFRLMADDHASTRDVAIDIAEGYLKVARSSPLRVRLLDATDVPRALRSHCRYSI
jgi:hypothetical protein